MVAAARAVAAAMAAVVGFRKVYSRPALSFAAT